MDAGDPTDEEKAAAAAAAVAEAKLSLLRADSGPCAEYVVEEIVGDALEEVYELENQRLAPRVLVAEMVKQIASVVGMATVSSFAHPTHPLAPEDAAMLTAGGAGADEDEAAPSFAADGEPAPVPIDRHAALRVPVAPRAPRLEDPLSSALVDDDASSVASTSTRGASRRSSRRPRSRKGGTLEEQVSVEFHGRQLGVPYPLAPQPELELSAWQRKHLKNLDKQVREKEERRLAAELQGKEEGARQAAWKKELQKLAGKRYTVDASGKVIVVDVPKAEKLPKRTYPPRARVNDATKGKGGGAAPDPADDGSVLTTQTAPAVMFGDDGLPGPDGKKKKWYTKRLGIQRALTKSMKKQNVSAGCSIQAEGKTLDGGEPMPDKDHMSMAEYKSQTASLSKFALGGAGDDDDDLPILPDDSSTIATSRHDAQTVQPPRAPPMFPDIDRFAGARRRSRSRASAGDDGSSTGTGNTHSDNDDDSSAGGSTEGPPGGGAEASDISSWRIGASPTAKQKSDLGIPVWQKSTRDRISPSNVIPTYYSQHLPQPPLGHARGHGLHVGGEANDEMSVITRLSVVFNQQNNAAPHGGHVDLEGSSNASTASSDGAPGGADEPATVGPEPPVLPEPADRLISRVPPSELFR